MVAHSAEGVPGGPHAGHPHDLLPSHPGGQQA